MNANLRPSRISRQVRIQFFRISFIYALVAALVIWQWHFVVTGLRSNPYLNGLIIGVFLFGTLEALLFLRRLNGEKVGLNALEEVYRDAMERRKPLAEGAALRRYERCFRPAVVFKRPRILGHVYDFMVEQLGGDARSLISIVSMRDLSMTVESRLAAERSLLGYLASLCIFLGLIGTFIGLMEMVGSIGGVIGSLAKADEAGPEVIQQLIRSLEAPLTGMALGFSASLFGLFSSLVLGIILRLTGNVASALRQELEEMLARISRIEATAPSGSSPSAPVEVAQFHSLALSVTMALRRSAMAVREASDTIATLAQGQDRQTAILGETSRQLERLATEQHDIRMSLERVESLRRDVSALDEQSRRAAEELSRRIADGHAALHRSGEAGFATLADGLAKVGARQESLERMAQAEAAEARAQSKAVLASLAATDAAARESLGYVSSTVDMLAAGARGDREAADARQSVLISAIGSIGKQSDTAAARIDERMHAVSGHVATLANELGVVRNEAASQARAVEAGLESASVRIEAAERAAGSRFTALASALERTAADLVALGGSLRSGIEGLAERITGSFSRLESARAELVAQSERAADVSAQHLATLGDRDDRLAEALRVLGAETLRAQQANAALIRESLAQGFAELGTSLRDNQTQLAQALTRLSADHRETAALVSGPRAISTEIGTVARTLDERLSVGFEEIARTLEGLAVAPPIVPDPAPDAPLPSVATIPLEADPVSADALRVLATRANSRRVRQPT